MEQVAACLGSDDGVVFFLNGAQIQRNGAAACQRFQRHAAGDVMGVGVGAEDGGITVHEDLALAVDELGAQRHQHRLSLPLEIAGDIPNVEELEVAQHRAGAEGEAGAFAAGGILVVRRLPTGDTGGDDHRLGLEDKGLPRHIVEAHRTNDAVIFLDKVCDLDAA